MSKWDELKQNIKAKAVKGNLIYQLLLAMGLIVSTGSATVDFSAITDLINATVTVMSVMVANTSTFVGFAVLIGILGLISIIIYLFIGQIFIRAGHMLGGAMGKK